MSEHTKEPWRAEIEKAQDITRAEIFSGKSWIASAACRPYCDSEANARRIVACVNALVGVPTEALEAMDFGGRARLIQLQRVIEDVLNGNEPVPAHGRKEG